MAVLADDLVDALATIAGARSALLEPGDLPRLFGVGPGDAAETLAALTAEDLVSTWERPDGGVIVLTARGAERAGVELIDVGDDSMRWVDAAKERPAPKRWKRASKEDRVTVHETDATGPDVPRLFDVLADPRALDPAEFAERNDDPAPLTPGHKREQWKLRRQKTIAFGTGLVYGCQVPWPAVAVEGSPCPGCQERYRQKGAVCVICNRASTDGEVPPIPERTEKPRPARRRRAARGGKLAAVGELAGGTGQAGPGKATLPREPPKRRGKGKGKGKGRAFTAGNSFDLAKLRASLDARAKGGAAPTS